MNVPGFAQSSKFCDFKNHSVLRDFHQLRAKNPKLLAVLLYAGFLAWVMYGKKITLTSIHRTTQDPNKLHQNWQAADLRIQRNLGESKELTKEEWEFIAGMLNDVFLYGKTWSGRKTKVAHLRYGGDDGPDSVMHVHIQVKDRGVWR